MGSVSLKLPDGGRLRRPHTLLLLLCSPTLLTLVLLLSLLSTNLLALLAFTSRPPISTTTASPAAANLSGAIFDHVAAIVREIEASQRRLHRLEASLPSIHSAAAASSLPSELLLFLSPHALPLGRDARSGLTHMPSSASHLCFKSPSSLSLLSLFMTYTPHSPCPYNATLPHRLISKACEPLPRRRCLTRSPAPRRTLPATGMGLDSRRWVRPRSEHEFLIDDVLSLANTRIRIGFDIAGGVANFAARMAERGVTIVTSVLDNAGKPMNEFVAARGLFPLLLSPAHRFPFYDGVFDLVHVGAALDEGGAPAMGQAESEEALEFFMFDVDRVLRAGGLLWIDSYWCGSDERRRIVTKLVERFRYKKLKWVVGEKVDGGGMKVYLSAVLRKPAR